MIVLILILIGCAGAYTALPFILKALMRRRFRALKRKDGAVCLTFDDGPDPLTTPDILEALSESGARATFFLLGRHAEEHPELAARIISEGHEVGEHSHSHLHPYATGPIAYWRDINGGRVTVDRLRGTGRYPLFRPPWGKLNALTLLYVILHRRRIILWDLDPKDFANDTPGRISSFVNENIRPGQIVLFHDGRYKKGLSRNVTAPAVRMILKDLGRRGLSAVTVSEILMWGPQ